MAKHILLVDKDEAYGTVVMEAITSAGAFDVKLVTSAASALTTLRQAMFDLVIFDMGVDDVPPQQFVRGMRLLRANIPILVFPLDGDEMPPELTNSGLQGSMHKIFFRFDFAERLAGILGVDVQVSPTTLGILPDPPAPPPQPTSFRSRLRGGSPAPAPAPEPVREERPPAREERRPSTGTLGREERPPAREERRPSTGTLGREEREAPREVPREAPREPPRREVPELRLGTRASDEIDYQLRMLAKELNADAVLFTYGGKLVASGGMLPRNRIADMAGALDETWQAMHRLGALVGGSEGINQALFEGKEHIVYSVTVAVHGAITVATQVGTSPGAIRLRAREAANAIVQLIS